MIIEKMILVFKEVGKMVDRNKIEDIIEFVVKHPQSTASRTILRRYNINNIDFESSNELAFEIKEILKKKNKDEVEFCYYLIK